jgi:hypothetical protein
VLVVQELQLLVMVPQVVHQFMEWLWLLVVVVVAEQAQVVQVEAVVEPLLQTEFLTLER